MSQLPGNAGVREVYVTARNLNLAAVLVPRVSVLLCVLVSSLLAASGCAGAEQPSLDDGGGGFDTKPIPTPEGPFVRITHVDVGQGDATLIESPQKTMLIDAGDNGMGTNRVLRVLAEYGITALDYVVTTHPHADHVGGMDEVLAAVDALEGVFDNGDATSTQSFQSYASAAANSSGGRRTIVPGHVFDLGGGATVTCYAVNGLFLDGWEVYDADSTNDRSVVLVLEWGDFRYVIAGDLGGYDTDSVADVETSLGWLIGDVDVLRVSHHGSRYSTNPAWLNALAPEVAVISAGNGNDYGHPAADTLARLTGEDTDVTVPAPDLFLTQKGAAPSPYSSSGDVVVVVQTGKYHVEDSEYDPSGG